MNKKVIVTYKGIDIFESGYANNPYELYLELPILGKTAFVARTIDEARKLIDDGPTKH